jgi:uncharacterized protein
MAKDNNCSIKELISNKEIRDKIKLEKYVSDTIGLPTLNDIMAELDKPGRDPRPEFELFSFSEEVHSITDLKVGMKLPGIVTNVTKFGAFVDVGAHQDGLVHISQLADKYISDPNEIVKVNQKVEVTVMEVDVKRKRIALSMKSTGEKTKTQLKQSNKVSVKENKFTRKKEKDQNSSKKNFGNSLGELFDF